MKKIISIILSIVIITSLLCVNYSVGHIDAYAADNDQLTDGVTWSGTWPCISPTKRLYLNVEETGYYNLTIEDFNKTGKLYLNISDKNTIDSDVWYSTDLSIFSLVNNGYQFSNIYLISDHLYEISCEYYDSMYLPSEHIPVDANISLCFTKNNYASSKVELGKIHKINTDYKSIAWIEFTSALEGDYKIECDTIVDGTIDIYEKKSGKYVDSLDISKYNLLRTRLKANTTYVATSRCYNYNGCTVGIQVNKAKKDISKIEIYNNKITLGELHYEYNNNLYLYPNYYDYKVIYTDNSTELITFNDLLSNGIWVYEILYKGETSSHEKENFLCAGSQPIEISYMNKQTASANIKITSFLNYCSSLYLVSDDEEMMIMRDDSQTYVCYWRIKPNKTFLYEFYSANWEQLDKTITVFDKNNNVVKYVYDENDKSNNGWALESGEFYCLRIKYKYNSGCRENVYFRFKQNPSHQHVYKYECDQNCNICGARKLGYADHEYTNVCDTTCNFCGETREVGEHKYSNPCDAICKFCGDERTISHNYVDMVAVKATTTRNGYSSYRCSRCDLEKSRTNIYRIDTVRLSTTEYTYNGKVRTPSVIVKDTKGKTISSQYYTVTYDSGRKSVGTYNVKVTFKGNYNGVITLTFKIKPISISKCSVKLSNTKYTYNGKVKTPSVTLKNASGTTLKKNFHYTVKYEAGRKYVGKYKVTITMKGNYSGTKTLYLTINPPRTTLKKVAGASKSIKVTVNKKTTQVSGYQVQYSTSKKFTNAKTKTITSAKTTSTTIKSLKAKRTYYVRVRTYKTVKGKRYYSGWSSYKSTKTR